jgi:DNA-binding LacI/PurR family transcriptional regulator
VRASLKDVAALAGVSVRTVSNVVTGSASVSPATRDRVQRAIETLNYRPNLAARNLRRGRTGLIGLAVPEIHSPYFGELVGRIVAAAQERSWTVLIEQTAGAPERERRLVEGIDGQIVDGLLISPWSVSAAELRACSAELPIVLLGERDPEGLTDHVAVDNVAAADQATTHLLELGRRRVAAVGLQPHLDNGTASQRLAGYRRALARFGIAADPELEIAVPALHRADGARAMWRLLDGERVPDAVFAFSDELALGAQRTALSRSVRVPQDLAIIGFDDIEDGRYTTPALTTISPDKEQIAERALQCLADRLHGPGRGLPVHRIVVPHRLVVRESTRGMPAGR